MKGMSARALYRLVQDIGCLTTQKQARHTNVSDTSSDYTTPISFGPRDYVVPSIAGTNTHSLGFFIILQFGHSLHGNQRSSVYADRTRSETLSFNSRGQNLPIELFIRHVSSTFYSKSFLILIQYVDDIADILCRLWVYQASRFLLSSCLVPVLGL